VGLLAHDLRSQPSFRRWIVDYFSSEAVAYHAKSAIGSKMKNAPFRFDPADYFGFFQEHQWRAMETRYLWDEGVSLRRPLPLPRAAALAFRILRPFTPRVRLDAMRKFIGYVLLEAC
jgi:hypothetical protein